DYCAGGTITRLYQIIDDTGDGMGGPPDEMWNMGEDSVHCIQRFTVVAPAAVDVSCPSNVNASVCDYADQAALTAAYNAWLAAFSVVEDGCGATGAFDATPPSSIDYC